MENRKELLDYTVSQLIELAMQERKETPEEDAAEARKGEISDQISRDTRLSGEQRALLLEYFSLLEGLACRRLLERFLRSAAGQRRHGAQGSSAGQKRTPGQLLFLRHLPLLRSSPISVPSRFLRTFGQPYMPASRCASSSSVTSR